MPSRIRQFVQVLHETEAAVQNDLMVVLVSNLWNIVHRLDRNQATKQFRENEIPFSGYQVVDTRVPEYLLGSGRCIYAAKDNGNSRTHALHDIGTLQRLFFIDRHVVGYSDNLWIKCLQLRRHLLRVISIAHKELAIRIPGSNASLSSEGYVKYEHLVPCLLKGCCDAGQPHRRDNGSHVPRKAMDKRINQADSHPHPPRLLAFASWAGCSAMALSAGALHFSIWCTNPLDHCLSGPWV